MSLKPFSLFVATCLLSQAVFAQYQSLYTRIGANLFTSWHTGSSKVIVVPELSVTAGIRLVQSKDAMACIALPLSLGFSSKSDIYFGIDLPLMFEMHLGSAVANNEKAKIGTMLGCGLAYNYSGNYWDGPGSRIESDFWGLRFEAGLSFKPDHIGNIVMLVFSYGRGLADPNKNLLMAGIQVIPFNR